MITVVAALIESDGKYLMARRAYGNPEVIGKWEFPGGKVEPNEEEKEAIERELNEEFDIKIKAEEYLMHNVCTYPERTIDLKLYRCSYQSGEFRLHDHTEYQFFSLEEIPLGEVCPADCPFIEELKGRK